MSRARDFADLAGAADAGGLTGRNMVVNGAMQVAQRGTQTGQTGTVYTACDRFLTAEVGDTVTTSSQDTDVPSGQGFANSLKIDVTTADASLAASDVFLVMTRLEGQNLQHLLYGTSNAKALTLSFWVKSPKAGTHILELRQNDATYFNSQAYTVASANTWQKVELTFSGYTATAFDNDNAYSLGITWFLAAGSNYSSGTLSSNTWHNTQANRAVGQVNCVDDAANNFYITGVQLEVGEQATPFEHRSYGEELSLCQRYAIRYTQGNQLRGFEGSFGNGTNTRVTIKPYVPMRATPTMTVNDAGESLRDFVAWYAASSASLLSSTSNEFITVGVVHADTGLASAGNTVAWWGGFDIVLDAEL